MEIQATPGFFQRVKKRRKGLFVALLAILLIVLVSAGEMNTTLHAAYEGEISKQVLDQNGDILQRLPNQKGHFMTIGSSTERVRELIIRKEDRFFYKHPGINPGSIIRSLFHKLMYGDHTGGSTITQQLVKNLLGHENERSVANKFAEVFYALAIELYTPKEEILTMYLSSAYFGNQIEGIEGGAQYYFGKSTALLTDGEIVRLIALLSAPSFQPGSAGNTVRATNLGRRLNVTDIAAYTSIPRSLREQRKDPALFEIASLSAFTECGNTCTLSIDRELTATIRAIVSNRLGTKQFASVGNAAVVVIKLGSEEESNKLLALVGTPDPYSAIDGNQINMALAPRPIGSTWKPFIYGEAIEAGARPYSIIDDTEYRYEIGTGYAFYPKNYDGIYRGDVTLHYALSNSLNVPAVRALQFDGIDRFGSFMKNTLGFIPRQSFDTYQLSVALGGLEMNPLLLAHYFTVFPRNGVLAPLELIKGIPVEIPMSTSVGSVKQILRATTTALINKMLSDRLMGVEQFGLESNLDLPFTNYAVKTGTSYDYHDSWTVGYTPDTVVVVWIGNSDNKPMDLLTGSRGAGRIWSDVMTLLKARGDITQQPFDANAIVDAETQEGRSFGLPGDDVEYSRLIMRGNEVILEPHDRDVLLYQPGMSIPLRAKRALSWSIDGKVLGEGEKVFWSPDGPGEYVVSARESEGSLVDTLRIRVTN